MVLFPLKQLFLLLENLLLQFAPPYPITIFKHIYVYLVGLMRINFFPKM